MTALNILHISIQRLLYRRRHHRAASRIHYQARLDCAVEYVLQAQAAGSWRSLAQLAAIGKYKLDRRPL